MNSAYIASFLNLGCVPSVARYNQNISGYGRSALSGETAQRHVSRGHGHHAVAYKHAPLVENNIAEGVINNVMGTLNTAQAALLTGVTSLVLISTDKAVRQTDIMGRHKKLTELFQVPSCETITFMFGDKSDANQINNPVYSSLS